MALHYSGVTIGTLTLCKPVMEMEGDKYVEKKDEKGRTVYNKYKIQIRRSNVLMCALYVHKIVNPEEPKKCWMHDLVTFFVDERHLKNCVKDHKTDVFESEFRGKLRDIRLNIYYKEMLTLARYMAKDGLKVQVYYEDPKNK